MNKQKIITNTLNWLKENNLHIFTQDLDRPWGAFWHIDKSSLTNFLYLFFKNTPPADNLSPKILLVEANKKLSLQLHHKRSEKWKVIKGPVQVIVDNKESILNENEEVEIKSGETHRLCGLDDHGLVAEIWIHNDLSSPSDENDIERLQDDFGRNKKKSNYAVIMAGGAGTRLWPLSRDLSPKQFQSLVSDNTLIQDTYERIKLALPIENIFISTNTKYIKIAKKQLPQVPDQNFIVEPAKRNTAPALAFVAKYIYKLDKEANIATYVSDHVIKDKKKFAKIAQITYDIINKYPKKLIIIGITPNKADTNLGYIKKNSKIDSINDFPIFKIDAFTEKPDFETAKKYFKSNNYLWNAAYYGFKASEMLSWIKEYCPKTWKIIDKELPYEEVENQQFEPTILQQESFKDKVILLPATFNWSDIGTWDTLLDVLKTPEKNIVTRGNTVNYKTKNSLIYGQNKLIATLGLKDIIIIETEDVILVTSKKEAPNIKNILNKVDKKYL